MNSPHARIGKRWCLVVILVLLGARAGHAQPPAPPRLNVLLIIADDLNTSLGTYGAPVATPNIDALARRGMRFDRAYVQYALCNPSRTSFLSGRRPATTGVTNNSIAPRVAIGDAAFLPQHFRQQGYFTARAGKIFHISRRYTVNHDDPRSWDETFNEPIVEGPPLDAAVVGRRGDIPLSEGEPLQWAAVDVPDARLGDGHVAARAVATLERAAAADRPFFVAVGFRRPHLPWETPAGYFTRYSPGGLALGGEPPDDAADIPPVALTYGAADRKLTEAERRQAIAAYYASVTYMDAQVGLVLRALERTGARDRTIVVFMGDHGYHLGEHGGMWTKPGLFEQTARFPLIVAAPGRRAGAASASIVEALDLYPTVAELAGLPAPAGLEGRSFVSLLDTPDAAFRDSAVTEFVHRGVVGRSVRTVRWRYTEWDDGRAGAELYDHERDPGEFANLANDPRHETVKRELAAALRRVPAIRPGGIK